MTPLCFLGGVEGKGDVLLSMSKEGSSERVWVDLVEATFSGAGIFFLAVTAEWAALGSEGRKKNG